MKKIISHISIFIFYCFFSLNCGDSIEDSLNKKLSEANKIKLYFTFLDSLKSQNTTKIFTIDDPEEVKILKDGILDKSTEEQRCGKPGTMEFLNEYKSVLNTEVYLDPSCTQIIFMIKDRMYYKKISTSAQDLLRKYENRIYNK